MPTEATAEVGALGQEWQAAIGIASKGTPCRPHRQVKAVQRTQRLSVSMGQRLEHARKRQAKWAASRVAKKLHEGMGRCWDFPSASKCSIEVHE